MKYLYIFFLPFIFALHSCEVINPDEDMPSFIRVDSMTFTSDFGEGTNKADISDIWLYVNGDLIGAFEMPFEVPVLKSGASNIIANPGIIVNGIAGTRSINPFYTNYDKNMTLKVGEVTRMQPTCKYVDGPTYPWNNRGEEDFEEGGISIDSISGSSVKINKTTDDIFEGLYSGHIKLDAGHKTYYGQSTSAFKLVDNGSGVVMELHIKNDIPLSIGMFTYLPGGSIKSEVHMGVNPGSEWRKLYVNFTELVSSHPTAVGYRVFFKASISSEQEGNIYLDNIKIMHF